MSVAERQAPELRVQRWIDQDGGSVVRPLRLSDVGTGPRILVAFQDWLAGVDVRERDAAVIWCKCFDQFIIAAGYRLSRQARK